MSDLDNARRLLAEGSFTCVLSRGKTVYTSQARGVAPLLEFLESGADYSGFSAADKVAGKAAALLYSALKIKALYAHTGSAPAAACLSAAGISYEFGETVPGIINRRGDGPCPMENAVKNIDVPKDAVQAVKAALAAMKGGAEIKDKP